MFENTTALNFKKMTHPVQEQAGRYLAELKILIFNFTIPVSRTTQFLFKNLTHPVQQDKEGSYLAEWIILKV